MRTLALLLALLWPLTALGQSKTVLPSELELSVTVEDTGYTPFVREMILITIRGVYRRHITREVLVQPDLEGFSWSQLGSDSWADERIDGVKVKTLTRRMAIYPDQAGRLTIGAFKHTLTLTDEGDDWFEHEIQSEPVSVEVAPAPKTDGWWFPVRSLKISDQWSNAPDQLEPGEGVLRVIRIEALGVTPEMLPPMPELKSPSGMLFPHPDKRLAELSPDGPISFSFWRWTIQPSNDVSAIVEPLTFSYFDTTERKARTVTISAQRVAYGDTKPEAASAPAPVPTEARLPSWAAALVGGVVFIVGLGGSLMGRQFAGFAALRRWPLFDPLARRLRKAARDADASGVRRAAAAIQKRDGATEVRSLLISRIDQAIFSGQGSVPDLRAFVASFFKPTASPTLKG